MNEQSLNEIWQVEVGGQVYEAPFAELSDWINEGSLLPSDKVRRGNLRWIEARRVPTLVPFFNAKENGVPPPVVVRTVDPPQIEEVPVELSIPVVAAESFPASNTVVSTSDPVEHSLAIPAEPQIHNPDFCAIHTDLPTVFLCDGCGSGFCKVCPKSYGGSVRTCPFCGALCRALSEMKHKQVQTEHRAAVIREGFGAADFFNALGHPFKFKTSLFFGAVFFTLFTLGQSAAAFGGIYMMTSALFCGSLANMLTFGVLANTIDRFSKGDLSANFMPAFEDFDLSEDVVRPVWLSIAAYISSFGPFIAVLLVGFYLVTSSTASQMDAFRQRVGSIPGTPHYDTKRTLEQSDEVQGVIGEVDRAQSDRLNELEESRAGAYGNEEDLGAETGGGLIETEDGRKVDRETLAQEELWAMAQESRKQSFEGAIGKSPETLETEREAMYQGFLNLAPPLVVAGAIFFLWGLFYFPMACMVAGYSKSFSSTINPLVGLDAIRHIGGTYFLVFIMSTALLIASVFVSGILGALLKPLDLPNFGNLPATAISSLFAFYLWAVFCCVLGYAVFKKSDELQVQS